jgi:hypothetical protein
MLAAFMKRRREKYTFFPDQRKTCRRSLAAFYSGMRTRLDMGKVYHEEKYLCNWWKMGGYQIKRPPVEKLGETQKPAEYNPIFFRRVNSRQLPLRLPPFDQVTLVRIPAPRRPGHP